MPAERCAEISKSLIRSTTIEAAVSRLDQNETVGLPEGLRAKLFTTLLFVFTGLWIVLLFGRLVVLAAIKPPVRFSRAVGIHSQSAAR